MTTSERRPTRWQAVRALAAVDFRLLLHDRVALFRLAQEVAVSGFGSRQVLYERFFFGPPEMLASTYYRLYSKDDLMGRVQEMLVRARAS